MPVTAQIIIGSLVLGFGGLAYFRWATKALEAKYPRPSDTAGADSAHRVAEG